MFGKHYLDRNDKVQMDKKQNQCTSIWYVTTKQEVEVQLALQDWEQKVAKYTNN